MSGRLIGKVALVSGGARGMGASHVRAMVAEGAKVVFGDILDEEGKAVAAELADAARYVHLDVTQPAQWTAAVDTAVTAFGGLHVLVNNAGILNIGTIEDYALTEWQRILDVNLTGVFLGIRAVVKPMKEAGRGSIINISSIEGLAGTVACHGYTATKFAVRGLTKSTALELGPGGIRVNSIHPGLVKTPMTDWVPEDIFQTALGRAAEPVEVSNLVVYLASDESSYSTGAEFVVDGGTVAGLAHNDFGAVEVSSQPEWVTQTPIGRQCPTGLAMTIASALNRNRIPSRPVPHPAQGTASWWLFRLEWVIILRLVRLVDRRDSNEAGAGLDTVMGGFDVVPGESRRLVQRAAAGDDPESRVCEQLFEFGRGVEAGVAVAWLSAGRAQSVQVGPRCPARQEPDNKAAAVGEQTPRFPEYGGRVGDETERECHEDRPEVPADERDRLADGIGDQDAAPACEHQRITGWIESEPHAEQVGETSCTDTDFQAWLGKDLDERPQRGDLGRQDRPPGG